MSQFLVRGYFVIAEELFAERPVLRGSLYLAEVLQQFAFAVALGQRVEELLHPGLSYFAVELDVDFGAGDVRTVEAANHQQCLDEEEEQKNDVRYQHPVG